MLTAKYCVSVLLESINSSNLVFLHLFYSGFYADLVKEDKILHSLASMLAVLDKILKKEVIINCFDPVGWELDYADF